MARFADELASKELIVVGELMESADRDFLSLMSPFEIIDKPHAKPRGCTLDQIHFDRVSFRYKNGNKLLITFQSRLSLGQKVVGLAGRTRSW